MTEEELQLKQALTERQGECAALKEEVGKIGGLRNGKRS